MSTSANPRKSIVNAIVIDPQRPYFRDYLLECGHRMAHRVLPRNPKTKRMYIPKFCNCTICGDVIRRQRQASTRQAA